MVNPGFGWELYSIRNADPQGEVPYRCARPDNSDDKSADRSGIVTRPDRYGTVLGF